jgi:hypothetical protein
MTREQFIKHWKLIEAFKNGAEIEFYDEEDGEWENVSSPYFSTADKYRVKPKQEVLPFTFDDAEFLIRKDVKRKNGKGITSIYGVEETRVNTAFSNYTFDYLLEYFTFLDGSPCGKLANQEESESNTENDAESIADNEENIVALEDITEQIEFPVGTVFSYGNEKYKVVEDSAKNEACTGCPFDNNKSICDKMYCSNMNRSDNICTFINKLT